jgi:hypothetical protein
MCFRYTCPVIWLFVLSGVLNFLDLRWQNADWNGRPPVVLLRKDVDLLHAVPSDPLAQAVWMRWSSFRELQALEYDPERGYNQTGAALARQLAPYGVEFYYTAKAPNRAPWADWHEVERSLAPFALVYYPEDRGQSAWLLHLAPGVNMEVWHQTPVPAKIANSSRALWEGTGVV